MKTKTKPQASKRTREIRKFWHALAVGVLPVDEVIR